MGLLLDNKQDLFCVGGTFVVTRAKLNTLYHGLRDLIREPLTKNEVTFLINKLENKKNNLTPSSACITRLSDSYTLRSIFMISQDIILHKDEDLEGPEFTRLLENFFIQKNYVNFRQKHSDLSIDSVIGELKEFIKRMNG